MESGHKDLSKTYALMGDFKKAHEQLIQSEKFNSAMLKDQNTNQLNRAAEIALENSINIPPTIHVDHGTPIQVFVARDLDFRSVSPR